MTEPTDVLDAGPFDLGAGRTAALCVHGLTGTPYEVRPVAEALARAGMRALGPALPGHEDESPEPLTRIRHEAWIEGVRSAYRTLCDAHEQVVVVGVSLGGLLSLALASEERVAGLAVIGTPIRLRFPIPQVIPWLRYLRSYVRKRNGGPDIRDPEARARHPSFDVMPLNAVHELMRLQARVRPRLSDVEAPILIAHGVHDATAHPDDARVIEAGVSSSRRELLMLPESGHIVPVDHDGPALADAISGFFSGLA